MDGLVFGGQVKRLSQRLVQDVTVRVADPNSHSDDKSDKQHLEWISWLRVQAGRVQALVSKAGISRYADHSELMTQMVEHMKFPRILTLLDERLTQFDVFYKKVHDDAAQDEENVERLTDSLVIILGTIIGLASIPGMHEYWKRDHPGGIAISIFIMTPLVLFRIFGKQVFRFSNWKRHRLIISFLIMAVPLAGYYGGKPIFRGLRFLTEKGLNLLIASH